MDQDRSSNSTDALKQILAGNYQVKAKDIIIKALKFDNDFLKAYVENMQTQKIPDEQIIKVILEFDRLVQLGKLTLKDIEQMKKEKLNNINTNTQ